MADKVEQLVQKVGVPAAVGVGGGLLAYFLQESISREMQDKPWILPLLAGFASAGAAYFLIGRGA
jgi:hypothetical protein